MKHERLLRPARIDLTGKAVGIIGLGYVGLPAAVAFAQHRSVVGFDTRAQRIADLTRGHDETLEVGADELNDAQGLTVSGDAADLVGCGVFVVTVPTPIDAANRPDLSPLERACETVGKAMAAAGEAAHGTVVVFESTVYPGATRDVCVPLLEAWSGLTHNRHFYTGYSPERINPGDATRRLADIVKVTSGSTPAAAAAVDALYAEIITAGTYKTPSIEVAEAAKVIENTQRDLNIALINELAILFDKLGLDTREVLDAAETKWNFLPFRPGLVGGHCIGVDPYYLTHCAQQIGHHPEVILAGRRVNDAMGTYLADRIVHLMLKRRIAVADARILVMGLAFKENCPDLRNSKVAGVIARFTEFGAQVDVHDPWVDPRDAEREFGLSVLDTDPEPGSYDAILVAVGHRQFVETGAEAIRRYGKAGAVLFDAKGLFARSDSDGRL